MKYMDIKKYIKNIYNGFYEIFIEGNDKKHLQKFIDEKHGKEVPEQKLLKTPLLLISDQYLSLQVCRY